MTSFIHLLCQLQTIFSFCRISIKYFPCRSVLYIEETDFSSEGDDTDISTTIASPREVCFSIEVKENVLIDQCTCKI